MNNLTNTMTIRPIGAMKGARVVIGTMPSGRLVADFYRSARQVKRNAFGYPNTTARRYAVMEWVKRQIEAEQKRAARRIVKRDLKLGDVLRASWGYDQTNIDYYEVVKLVGKTMVEIRELAQRRTHGDMRGECSPKVGEYVGEAVRVKAQGDHVKVGHTYASKMEAKIVAGAKIYKTDSYTAYH